MNNGAEEGRVTLILPPSTEPIYKLFYTCEYHKEMSGEINIEYPKL